MIFFLYKVSFFGKARLLSWERGVNEGCVQEGDPSLSLHPLHLPLGRAEMDFRGESMRTVETAES